MLALEGAKEDNDGWGREGRTCCCLSNIKQVENEANIIDDTSVAIQFNLRELESVSFRFRHSHLIEFNTQNYWTTHRRHFSYRLAPLVSQLSSTYHFLRVISSKWKSGDSGNALQCKLSRQILLFKEALSGISLEAMYRRGIILRQRSARSTDSGIVWARSWSGMNQQNNFPQG